MSRIYIEPLWAAEFGLCSQGALLSRPKRKRDQAVAPLKTLWAQTENVGMLWPRQTPERKDLN